MHSQTRTETAGECRQTRWHGLATRLRVEARQCHSLRSRSKRRRVQSRVCRRRSESVGEQHPTATQFVSRATLTGAPGTHGTTHCHGTGDCGEETLAATTHPRRADCFFHPIRIQWPVPAPHAIFSHAASYGAYARYSGCQK
jgi:hypothetical protein